MSKNDLKFSTAAIDLDNLSEAEEIEHVVINPKTGDPVIAADDTPWKVRLAGPQHAETIKLRNTAIGRTLKAQRLRGDQDPDPEQLAKETIDALVARTLGWNAPVMQGKPVEFSKAVAREVYTKFSWLRNQLQRRLADEAGFLTSPASD